MLNYLFGETSILWSLILLSVFTTGNSTSPLGMLVGLVLVIRPVMLDTWWSELVLTYPPLTLIGVIIPLITLLVYWVHGLLHLIVDVTRWPPLYKYKIQPNKHLDVSTIPHLFFTLIKVQLMVFLPVSYMFAFISVNTKYGLWTEDMSLPSNRSIVLHLLGYALVDEIFFYTNH